MKFTKYHGLGNDFVLINEEYLSDVQPETDIGLTAIKVCDRHIGIGADGLIIVKKDPLFMDVYNSDGSRSAMCGNGIRCFAKYCIDNGIISQGVIEFDVGTLSGIKKIRLVENPGNGNIDDFKVEVGMGMPDFSRKSLHIDGDGDFLKQEIEVRGKKIIVSGVNTGVPHIVVWLDDNEITEAGPAMDLFMDEEISAFGKALCFDPLFTEQANIDFAIVTAPDEITMITYEKGAGITAACGTGATAAALLGMTEKGLGNEVLVHLPYGDMNIRRAGSGEMLMTGSASFVYSGETEL